MSGTPVSSGSAYFLPDILDLCQEAAERAGVDFTSGQSLRSARLALDLMSLEWANEGLNLWLVDTQTITLQPGISKYSLPSDTLDIIYSLLRVTDTSGNSLDYPLNRIDVTDYAALPSKMQAGRPQLVYVDRQVSPTLTVWPVPADTTATLVYYRMRRIQDPGKVTNAMDIPSRFIPAMIAGLAYRFAQKSKDPLALQKAPLLKMEYQETFDKARYEDRQKTSVFLTPFVDY